jgi:hypothetical protein
VDILRPLWYDSRMRIVEARATERYRVFLKFDNGSSGIVDLGEYAGRGVFRAWEAEGIFEQVSVSPVGALEWPGDLDLCPDSLYLKIVGKTASEVFPGMRSSLRHA